MNPRLENLYAYPFARLRALLSDVKCNPDLPPISLAVGQPQHAVPEIASKAIVDNLDKLNVYPAAQGDAFLRDAIAQWLNSRYRLAGALDAESMVLPVLGTREALFAIAQTVVDSTIADSTMDSTTARPSKTDALVMLPSPFYQIYEGAAIMAGASPYYMPCVDKNNFLPDLGSIPESVWRRCQLLYLCNPSNPTGVQIDHRYYEQVLAFADRYDFVIVSDECYSEIYLDEYRPCVGLLEVCHGVGRNDFSRCLVFNSLSKRSNLAGLRSGFVAGDAELIRQFLTYRTYHGAMMPYHHQCASVAAWQDELHVIENRTLYRQKFESVIPVLRQKLEVSAPEGGFCLWLKVPFDDQKFARELYAQQNVTVLPGSYLAREVDGVNPGRNYVRIALVYDEARCIEAARRIVDYLQVSL